MMARDIRFSTPGWCDYHSWRAMNSKTFERLTALINECRRSPFKGTGKPEALKGRKAWSRRIDEKHRFVYMVTDEQLVVVSCRGHYGDH